MTYEPTEWTDPTEDEKQAYLRQVQSAAWNVMRDLDREKLTFKGRFKIFMKTLAAMKAEQRKLNKGWPEYKHHVYFTGLDIVAGLWMAKDGLNLHDPALIAVPDCKGGGHYTEFAYFCMIAKHMHELSYLADQMNEDDFSVDIYPEEEEALVPSFLNLLNDDWESKQQEKEQNESDG